MRLFAALHYLTQVLGNTLKINADNAANWMPWTYRDHFGGGHRLEIDSGGIVVYGSSAPLPTTYEM